MNPRGLPALLLTLAACGGDANVEGNYTVAITNGTNGCVIGNWEPGDQTTNIPVAVRQDGTSVSAEVMGLAGIGLGILLSSNVFTGEVDGDDFDLAITGAATFTSGGCAYTYNAELRGTLDGDAISGEILYRSATTDHPDCESVRGCVSVQQYNGTRPP